MQQKLTLSIDSELIPLAKKYAKEEGKSVSALVENFFKSIIKDKRNNFSESEILSKIDALTGVIDLEGRDYKEIVAEEIQKKYDRIK